MCVERERERGERGVLICVCMSSRQAAMQAGLKKAIEVPLELMRVGTSCWPHMMTIAQHGNITALSDIQVTKGKVKKSHSLMFVVLFVCLFCLFRLVLIAWTLVSEVATTMFASISSPSKTRRTWQGSGRRRRTCCATPQTASAHSWMSQTIESKKKTRPTRTP